jgi:hypothetical protein
LVFGISQNFRAKLVFVPSRIFQPQELEQVRSANTASDYQAALVQIFKTSDQPWSLNTVSGAPDSC